MFRFRLQKVLQYRLRLRDEQSRRLHQASENLARIRDMRHAIERHIQQRMTQMATERQARPDLRLWQLQSDYLRAQHGQREALQGREKSAVAEVVAARAKLIQAHQGVDVLRRLEGQQRAAWWQEEARRERKSMDEIGSVRASRRTKSGLP